MQHWRISLVVALAAAIAACASKPAPPLPPPPPFSASLSSSADVNPDAAGRASPILVKVLVLKAGDKFARAGFFDLFENPEAALGDELVGMGVSSVAPGATVQIEIPTVGEGAFIGVIAGYQNVDTAAWRDIAPVAALGEERKVIVSLAAGRAEIKKKSP